MSYSNDNDSGTAEIVEAVSFVTFALTSALWVFIMAVTPDTDRKGNFYVANEQTGWVVRMNNSNGNGTNITAPVATPEEASKLANEFNHVLNGHENK